MDINMTILGQFIFTSFFIVGGLSYYLAKRKTNTPKLATLIGLVLCVFPPLNIIYLAVLILKSDVVINGGVDTTV